MYIVQRRGDVKFRRVGIDPAADGHEVVVDVDGHTRRLRRAVVQTVSG